MARYTYGDQDGTDPAFNEAIKNLKEQFLNLVPELKEREPVFIFRLSKAGVPALRSLRRPVESTLFIMDDK